VITQYVQPARTDQQHLGQQQLLLGTEMMMHAARFHDVKANKLQITVISL
jgi:hypothetical protein